jgi:hypothetical protein
LNLIRGLDRAGRALAHWSESAGSNPLHTALPAQRPGRTSIIQQIRHQASQSTPTQSSGVSHSIRITTLWALAKHPSATPEIALPSILRSRTTCSIARSVELVKAQFHDSFRYLILLNDYRLCHPMPCSSQQGHNRSDPIPRHVLDREQPTDLSKEMIFRSHKRAYTGDWTAQFAPSSYPAYLVSINLIDNV